MVVDKERVQKAIEVLVDAVAERMLSKILRLHHFSLSEVSAIVEKVVPKIWPLLEPVTNHIVKKSDEYTVEVVDSKGYIRFLLEELRQLSSKVVDAAMEALAKHIEAVPESIYARLSWLLVNYSGRVSHTISKLTEILRLNPALAPMVEYMAFIVALRAYALYRIVSRLKPDEVAKLLDAIEAFVSAAGLEEEVMLKKVVGGYIESYDLA